MSREWFADFFQGLALEVWRRAVAPEQTEAEARFLARWLAPPAGGALLDVACGNGRLAVPLAGRGFRLTGVDTCTEFLDEARQRLPDHAWHRLDMRELAWEAAFDGAYCFGNSLGYFGRAGMAAFLGGVGRALRPGARFAFDTAMVAESLLPTLEERTWTPVADIHVLVEHDYDLRDSRVDTTYVFLRGARRETRRARHWVYTTGELCHWLQAAGLEPLALLESVEGEPFTLGSARLIGVAEKRRPEGAAG